MVKNSIADLEIFLILNLSIIRYSACTRREMEYALDKSAINYGVDTEPLLCLAMKQ